MSVPRILGLLGHDIKVGVLAVEHGLVALLHDAEAVFHVTLDVAKALGFSNDQILSTVAHYEQAAVTYVEGRLPEWDARTVAVLQNEFVKSSLIEKLGLGPAAAQLLTSLVGRLYATGSAKLPALVDLAVRAAESAAGLTPAS